MDVEKLVQALEKNRYSVSCFDTREAAADYLDSRIDGKTVGFGDSATLLSMGLPERLASHNEVHSPMHENDIGRFIEAAGECLQTQVFLTSANAVAESGELVNLDGTGNRVSGSLFGHEKVYFVVGWNKMETTLERAIWRARNAERQAFRQEDPLCSEGRPVLRLLKPRQNMQRAGYISQEDEQHRGRGGVDKRGTGPVAAIAARLANVCSSCRRHSQEPPAP